MSTGRRGASLRMEEGLDREGEAMSAVMRAEEGPDKPPDS